MIINKIKDFFYNINDIVVALLILALAGMIIYTKVSDIMDYPAYAAHKQAQEEASGIGKVDFSDVDLTKGEVDENLNSNPESLEGQTGENTEDGQTPPEEGQPAEPQPEAPQTGETIRITIPSGSTGSKIGEILAEAGLVESKEVFLKTVTAMKKDTKLQTGSFDIPKGASPEEIVKIITR